MSDTHHEIAERALSDAEIARALLPLMSRAAPWIGSAFDRAAETMIAEGELPGRAIEALHDLGHRIVRITETMRWERERQRRR